MKKITTICLLAWAALAVSCRNKDLVDPVQGGPAITVRINWATGLNVPTRDGMRINLFSLDEGVHHYGRADVPHHGAQVRLSVGTSHKTFAYNYSGNNVQFSNEEHPERIEAKVGAKVRSTYSRAFPDQTTIDEVRGDFHVGINDSYTVINIPDEQYIDVWPANAVITYTYEVRNVRGARYISEARGGIAGFSASYNLATGALADSPSTVLFDGQANPSDNTITGSFRTFGRLEMTNDFTIEILFPSAMPGNGIIQRTWDVTGQIDDNVNRHIIIDGSDIDIPEPPGDPGDDTGGWQVDVDDWEDVTVPLN